MNDDNTISTPALELGSDDLACARGGLPVDPHGDPGGPTGHPDFPPRDGFQIPAEKLPDPWITYPPPYKVPGETPPIIVLPIA
jgi:hypothetical protein